jgi:hypothetical protein
MNGAEYTGKGDTLLEAFQSFGFDYRSVKTKGEITVTHGDKKAQRLIQLPKLRRYFMSKTLLTGLIGNFETLLR